MKNVFCIAMLLISLSLFAGCSQERPEDIKLWGPNKGVTYRSFDTPEEYINNCSHIFEGVVVDISAEVFNSKTLKPQRFPIDSDDSKNYCVATVYTILVTQPYKGSSSVFEYMISEDGNWKETIVERKNAMERAGMYDTDIGVEAHRSNRTLEMNKTYLFCVEESDNGYMLETNYFLALGQDWNIATMIKEQLPRLASPLLIWGIVTAVVAVSVVTFLVIRARKKKKEELEIPEDE